MKILFLCPGGGSCRSLIAKTVMQSLDSKLEVYAAGLTKLSCRPDLLLEILANKGYRMEQTKQYLIDEIKAIGFDYLITLCEGTREEFYKLPLIYKHKLHLGFTDPENITAEINDKEMIYRELIEEINTELTYFYHHILKQSLRGGFEC